MAQWDDILSVLCSILIFFYVYAFCPSYFLKYHNRDMMGLCSELAVTFYVSSVKKNEEILIEMQILDTEIISPYCEWSQSSRITNSFSKKGLEVTIE